MSTTREQVVDTLFTAAIVGVGLLCGNPIIGQVVGGIGINWAADLTREAWGQARQRLLSEAGLLNHDLQQALARACRQAIAHLEQTWWQTPRGHQMRRSEPDAARVTGEAFKMLREDAAKFSTPDRLGRDAGNEQVRQLLYGDEVAMRRAFSARLAAYLQGHDPQLVAFIEAQLVEELVFWFGEELKADRPESNRAWRVFQRLLLEGLQAGVAQVRAEQQETNQALRGLQAWAERMEARPPEERENTGQDALVAMVAGTRDQLLETIAREAGLTRMTIEAGFEQIARLLRAELVRLRLELLPSMQGHGLIEDAVPLSVDLPRRFDGLLRDYTLFGGREDELAAIQDFLADPQARYLFVAGPSGYGKTALLAWWARHEEAAYHFLNRAWDTADEDLFLRNLCQQLAARHRLGGRLPVTIAELRVLYPTLLSLPPADGQPVVILIDGLDEALNWEPGPQHFPPDLPDGVKLIFSAREVAERDWPRHLHLPPERVRRLTLGAMTAEDMRALLQAASGAAQPLADDLPWIHQALQVSEGDPFYLKLLVEDILNGRMRPEQIGMQPVGLDAYLKGWWEQIATAVRARDVRDLLGSLAVARGRLRRDDLVAMFPDLGWALDGVLAEVRRFVIGNERAGYALAHPRFTSYARRRVGQRALQTYTDAVLAYCAEWQTHHSPYALRHYADHLREVGQHGLLLALARGGEFAAAQAAALSDEPDLPLHTLRLALAAAAAADDAGAMAEFLLRHARMVDETTQESPLAALRQGSLKRAWELADLLPIEQSILWHLLLAWELKDTGHLAEAQSTMERLFGRSVPRLSGWIANYCNDLLLNVIDLGEQRISAFSRQLLGADGSAYTSTIPPVARRDERWREQPLGAIVSEQARVGDFAGAIATAQRFGGGRWRVEALAFIASTQVQARDFAGAIATAQRIGSDERALEEIVAIQQQSGDFAGAAATAQRITDRKRRATALRKIAAAQAQIEAVVDAIVTARSIEHEDEQVAALGDIAVIQVKAGDTTGARSTLASAVTTSQNFEYDTALATALRGIAAAQVQAGDFAGAIATAESIKHPFFEPAETLGSIAVAQAQAGDFTGAIATVGCIRGQWGVANTLGAIAITQAQSGDFAGASVTTERIEGEATRAAALCGIAAAQAQAGDITAARSTFARASALAERIGNSRWRAAVLREIAVAQAQARNTIAARSTFASAIIATQGIEQEHEQVAALREIGAAQVRSGDITVARTTFANAVAIAESIEHIDEELLKIITIQSQVGDFTGAIAAAESIDDMVTRTAALRNIAAAQAGDGDITAARASFTDAIAAAQSIKDVSKRAMPLRDIAIAQAQAGDLAGALITAEVITDKVRRMEALLVITEVQAQAGDFAGALAAAEHIAANEERRRMLVAIAVAQARAGDAPGAAITFANALATAERIGNERERAEALGNIAAAQARAGDAPAARTTLARALAAAQLIAHNPERAEALEAMVGAKAQAGDFASAVVAAGHIADEGWRTEALGAIAAAQARAGDTTGALAAARHIADEGWRTQALGDIAAAQAGAGDFAGALATAEYIADRWERGTALRNIAVAQAQAGDFASALATAGCLVSEGQRGEVLRDIAVALAQAGDFAGALVTTGRIAPEWPRAEALGSIAAVLAQAGDTTAAAITFASALATAGDIVRPWLRAKALGSIAAAQARAGDTTDAATTFASALAVTGRIADESQRAAALRDIAAALAQIGATAGAQTVFASALDTTERIAVEWQRVGALQDIAVAQAQAGDLPSALATAERIAGGWDQAKALGAIAAVLAQAGDTKRALAAAGRIAHEGRRMLALRDIAATLAWAGLGDEGLHVSELILVRRDEYLPAIAAAMVEAGDNDHFKRLLIPCAYYLASAYQMCGLLARLYPVQAQVLKEQVLAAG